MGIPVPRLYYVRHHLLFEVYLIYANILKLVLSPSSGKLLSLDRPLVFFFCKFKISGDGWEQTGDIWNTRLVKK
jgi:hypothetical protein